MDYGDLVEYDDMIGGAARKKKKCKKKGTRFTKGSCAAKRYMASIRKLRGLKKCPKGKVRSRTTKRCHKKGSALVGGCDYCMGAGCMGCGGYMPITPGLINYYEQAVGNSLVGGVTKKKRRPKGAYKRDKSYCVSGPRLRQRISEDDYEIERLKELMTNKGLSTRGVERLLALEGQDEALHKLQRNWVTQENWPFRKLSGFRPSVSNPGRYKDANL